MESVSIVGTAQIPVRKHHDASLRQLGAQVIEAALADAGLESVDALYVSNMLSDELQSQKHIGALLADEAGLANIEAFQVRAATAGGAAALRVGLMAVASGSVETALILGVEKMSGGAATLALAKALDGEKEQPDGSTLISQVARLTQLYIDRYQPPTEALAHFAVNAHENASRNPYALFKDRRFTPRQVLESRVIMPPLRLLDCSPVCEGAAAVVLTSTDAARKLSTRPVKILASGAATDRFRMEDRNEPLVLTAAKLSAARAYRQAGASPDYIDFFELHDAFSIMSCLGLEATGFAEKGQGWRLALEGDIRLNGRIPVTTMGGLKARGHPIGATALYQVCEIVGQLQGAAGPNQLEGAKIALMLSVGGVASTVIAHVFGV